MNNMYQLRIHLRQFVQSSNLLKSLSVSRRHSSEQSKHQNESENNEDKSQKKYEESMQKSLILRGAFEGVNDKNKNTYLEMVNIFTNRDVHRRGHVEFIYAALKNMESFGVHQDLDVYKSLVDVMPKGKFIPQNMFQVEFQHYPKQQQCIIDLLEQMEDNGVMPDYEMENILINIFGRQGFPVRKFWRMMYWMPKFKNLSPWPVPNPPPNDIQELAKLALERMCSVDVKSLIKIYETKEIESAIDDTWIVSGQSSEQIELLKNNPRNLPIYIEGPFNIWIRNKSVSYFIMRGEKVQRNITKEDDIDGKLKKIIYTSILNIFAFTNFYLLTLNVLFI